MEIFIVHVDYYNALGHEEESRYCATEEIAERVKAEMEEDLRGELTFYNNQGAVTMIRCKSLLPNKAK